MIAPRAVTLLEMLVVTGVVLIGGLGIAKAVGHSLRLGERAQARAELVAVAQSELDRLRLQSAGQPWKPDHVRLLPARGVRVRVGHREQGEGLLAITVAVESLRSVYPLSVSLTGWVLGGEVIR